MMQCVKRIIRKQKIIVQVFLFTSSVIFLLSLSQFLLITVLSQEITTFIDNQLLQRIIVKNFQTKVDTIMSHALQVGKLEYIQFLLEDDALKQLYNFSQQKQFNGRGLFHICHIDKPKDELGYQDQDYHYSGIQSFVQLYQQFYPLTKLDAIKTYFVFSLKKDCYLVQKTSGDQQILLKHVIQMRDLFMKDKIPYIAQTLIFNSWYMTESLQMIGSDVVMGKSLKSNYDQYREKFSQNKIINLQQFVVSTTDGLIISNAQNQDLNGQYFQNSSISGFNQELFNIIINYSYVYPSNTCGYQYDFYIYCLKNIHNDTQIIYSKFTAPEIIIIFLLDTQELNDIQSMFQQQLKYIIDSTIFYNYYILGIVLVICFVIQYLMIQMLNKPLYQIQQIAEYRIRDDSWRIWNIMDVVRIKKQQSQIQQLCDSFYNLIFINQRKDRDLSPKREIQLHYQNYGSIWRRQYRQQRIFKLYKKINDYQQ